MCGFVAGLLHDGIEAGRIDRALETLRHRGPDAVGRWTAPDGRWFLGHTRLSIIGLGNGAQPMADANGDVRLVVNGDDVTAASCIAPGPIGANRSVLYSVPACDTWQRGETWTVAAQLDDGSIAHDWTVQFHPEIVDLNPNTTSSDIAALPISSLSDGARLLLTFASTADFRNK